MPNSFTAKIQAPNDISTPAYWFIFNNDHLLMDEQHKLLKTCPFDRPDIVRQFYLGLYNDTHCFAIEIKDNSPLPTNTEFKPLRATHEIIGDDLFKISGMAKQILHWDNHNQFCGHCGNKMSLSETERAKTCLQCNAVVYPRISPAIIVLISRGDEILLARSTHFRPKMFSTLAGFMEPGESCEQTVEREVMEEVGIHVTNIKYFGSQPWPFPNSLMLGFTADYLSGEINIDNDEIVEANWYSVDNLPQLPGKISIARMLIDDFIQSNK